MTTASCHSGCLLGASATDYNSALIRSLNTGEPTYDPRYLDGLGLSRAQSDKDVLDFERSCGLTISFNASGQNSTSTETLDLDQSNALDWLQDTKTFHTSGQRGLKLLWTHQIVRNDSLRAMRTGHAVSLPKSELASCLGLPENAIEKLGTDITCGIDFSTQLHSKSAICYAISAGTISVVWSYNASTQTTVALILARNGFAWPHRASFFDYVKEHKDLCHLPAWLPYIIASTEVVKVSYSLANCHRDAAENGRDLSRFCYNKKPILAFGAASDRVDTLLYLKTYVPFVLRMIEMDMFHTTAPRSSSSSSTNSSAQTCQRCEHDNTSILQLLDIRAQELKSLMASIESLQQRTTDQLSSILGMISFHQQSAAQELAEASVKDNKIMKEIAEATKKDSTSMKVLALMTVIFLPSTATSAIMAIPGMFDFTSNTDRTIVNSRFWIFFAVALPLTFITLVVTLVWLKWKDLGTPLLLLPRWITDIGNLRSRIGQPNGSGSSRRPGDVTKIV